MTSTIQPDKRVHVVEKGEGKPIVFIHGWPTGFEVWENQLEGLSRDHRVIALDLPGFGKSPAIEQPTMKKFAGVVRDVLKARDIDNAFIIGWSMGAGVVMSYCQHFGGERLRAMGIVDDCPKLLPDDEWLAEIDTPFSRELIADWKARWSEGERESVLLEATNREFKHPEKYPAEIRQLVEHSLRADPEPAWEALEEVMELDFRASLRDVQVPALLLYGAFSRMTTAANRDYMARVIPDATLVIFEESAHNPMIEEVDKFNAAVGRFASAV